LTTAIKKEKSGMPFNKENGGVSNLSKFIDRDRTDFFIPMMSIKFN